MLFKTRMLCGGNKCTGYNQENIARIVNAVQCHSLVLGHNGRGNFLFSFVRIILNFHKSIQEAWNQRPHGRPLHWWPLSFRTFQFKILPQRHRYFQNLLALNPDRNVIIITVTYSVRPSLTNSWFFTWCWIGWLKWGVKPGKAWTISVQWGRFAPKLYSYKINCQF